MYRFCLVLLAFGIYFLIVSYSKQPVYYQDKAIVLTYHHLDFVENDATLSPSTFAQHLDTLIQKQYNIISMETCQLQMKIPHYLHSNFPHYRQ
jgi:hypothetical protein